jgi:hypothetical protein
MSNKFRNISIFFSLVGLLFFSLTEAAEICEQHEFGSENTYFYIYSDGKSWDFTAENTMKVDKIEAKSVLATSSNRTFHIQIKINDIIAASWDQTVNSSTFKPYIQTATVNLDLLAGDKITYFIYGGTFSTPVGGILGINYVKLCHEETAEELVKNYVTRFYQLCLDRNPDTVGLEGWTDDLLNQIKTGADVAEGFIYSPEFIAKSTTNSQYLEILYKAFFNRDPDQAGWDTWLAELNSGRDRGEVLDGFIYSQEFAELCQNYGIKAFDDQRSRVEAFVTRFYQLCLDRNPDTAGLKGWTDDLLNQIKAGADVAEGFIYSPEFIAKSTTNSQYLEILYKAFFNRDPDQAGWDTWLAELNSGRDRGEVLDGFIYSQEFANLCDSYGIIPAIQKCQNVAGTWSVTEINDESNCGGGSAETEQMTYSVSQNGCNISVTNLTYGVGPFSGTVDGNHISWSGSYPEDGGTTTANISLNISGNSLSGSATWTWSGPGGPCSGSTRISGSRN